MNVNEELCTYLKTHEFYDFMLQWKKQYESYGRCGGTIHLMLNQKSGEALSSLMGKDYRNKKEVSITYLKFIKALKQTKFEDADFENVLKLYFSTDIVSNKEAKKKKDKEFHDFLEKIISEYQESYAATWLDDVRNSHNSVYIRLYQIWQENILVCEKVLHNGMKALNALPMIEGKRENMSIFSSSITGDPHAFDRNTLNFYLLFQGICYYKKRQSSSISLLEQNEILYDAGLYYDAVSNYCSIARLQAMDLNGFVHLGWKGFYETFETFNATMDNLEYVSTFDQVSSPLVIVVENPSIFQALLHSIRNEKYEYIGLICTNGQLNTAAYILLDKLVHADIRLLYAGDMDPEGLLIADRIQLRYGGKLTLWHYDLEDYQRSKSDKIPSENRLKMCDRLITPQLSAIAKYLGTEGVGYQENIIQLYLNDLCELNKAASKK